MSGKRKSDAPRSAGLPRAKNRTQRARLEGVEVHDLIWDALYAPISGFVAFAAERLNVLQFLTIRRYLSLVFAALILLLLVLAIWQ